MSRPIRGLAIVLAWLTIIIITTGAGARPSSGNCVPSSCGNVRNIRHPFRLRDSASCNRGPVELTCDRTVIHIGPRLIFHVRGIHYDDHVSSSGFSHASLWLVDPTASEHRSSSVSRLEYACGRWWARPTQFGIALVNCTKTASFRFTSNIDSNGHDQYYLYALNSSVITNQQQQQQAWVVDESCVVQATIPFPYTHFDSSVFPIPPLTLSNRTSLSDINHRLLNGFQVNVKIRNGELCYSQFLSRLIMVINFWLQQLKGFYTSLAIIGVLFLRTLCGVLCLIAYTFDKWRRRHSSIDDQIEEFLQNHNNLMPIKYSYSEIKIMTQGFKFKVGQGGFGSVYKGKLRSGDSMAVKVLLNNAKSTNGQDSINEVATIGRIHHVNIVRLVGFCVEGSNLALVYDFMPNGSLDKLLSRVVENEIGPVTWVQFHDIALGVARGIEYLHRGCEMQILHFDIKPHNILLDKNFEPKVSDFGLARLYPTEDSIISLTAARGTLGYIAPELFYKNIGGVSCKADVYSFGMLLMEMVGKRESANSFIIKQFNDIDFSTYVHDHIDQHTDQLMDLGGASEEEKKMISTMVIFAFQCIQMYPINRPSMRRVLEMLEGEAKSIKMPSKPSIDHH